jgi:predicted enzyme related to lactoylglutathione lyase
VQAAAAHGGTVRVEPLTVADLGVSAAIDDCGGARIGAWQANTFSGCGALARPGAPAWFEVLTRDYVETVAFYRDVFDWDAHVMSDSGDFRYTTLGQGDAARAGIMDASGFLPVSSPARWSTYFLVEDTDAALDTVTKLGGAATRPAEDTPFGRLAGAADPTGAPFNLIAR